MNTSKPLVLILLVSVLIYGCHPRPILSELEISSLLNSLGVLYQRNERDPHVFVEKARNVLDAQSHPKGKLLDEGIIRIYILRKIEDRSEQNKIVLEYAGEAFSFHEIDSRGRISAEAWRGIKQKFDLAR